MGLIRHVVVLDAADVGADPAGHPFCIGWGHPDADQLRRFLAQLPDEPS